MDHPKVLSVAQLTVGFRQRSSLIEAVKGISFDLEAGQTLGIVGESGSGKSVSSLAIMGLLPTHAEIKATKLELSTEAGTTHALLELDESRMRSLRGNEISMIFQEPMSSLNPVHTCGAQVREALLQHQAISRQAADQLVLDWFNRVKLPRVQEIFRSYPHQISGGQKQRVMIAMAMCTHPRVLIADEPTTALDVTVQRTILELMQELQDEFGMAIMFISHDLGVVGEISDKILVMYRGEQVEYGTAKQIFTQASHPYTQGLLACRPSIQARLDRLPTLQDFLQADSKTQSPQVISPEKWRERQAMLQTQPPILAARQLRTYFPQKKSRWGKVTDWVKAVDGVDLDIFPGETVGLVGESGCGKTTLGRTLLRMTAPYSGELSYRGENVLTKSQQDLRTWRKSVQLIFQDPYSSLNPRMPIGEAIGEPLLVHKLVTSSQAKEERVGELLEKVGLSKAHMKRYPHEFSGGQRQRIVIARALAVDPEFIICDESVSALDVSVQAQVLNLLKDLQSELGLTYLFISHDLSVVRFISDRILVMHEGKIVEHGLSEDLYQSPQHPYTQKLLEAIPAANWEQMEAARRSRLHRSSSGLPIE